MRPRTIKYYIKEAFRSLIVNRLMSIASIFAVSSSIFIVAVFYILGQNVEFFVHQLGEQIGLVVFIDEDLTRTEQQRLEERIWSITHVQNVVFTSREEALYRFSDILGPDRIRRLELDNPLRDSFAIEVTDLAYQEQVVRSLENLQGVANIRRDMQMADALTTLSSVVGIVSTVLVLILATISIIIITNTIRITVNARKNEINIMKYVGATDWFIRWPFVIEGLLIGLIGGAVPAFICWFGYRRVVGAIGSIPELAFLEFLPEDEILFYVFPFALILGTIIGLVGSSVSVRRHLKV